MAAAAPRHVEDRKNRKRSHSERKPTDRRSGTLGILGLVGFVGVRGESGATLRFYIRILSLTGLGKGKSYSENDTSDVTSYGGAASSSKHRFPVRVILLVCTGSLVFEPHPQKIFSAVFDFSWTLRTPER